MHNDHRIVITKTLSKHAISVPPAMGKLPCSDKRIVVFEKLFHIRLPHPAFLPNHLVHASMQLFLYVSPGLTKCHWPHINRNSKRARLPCMAVPFSFSSNMHIHYRLQVTKIAQTRAPAGSQQRLMGWNQQKLAEKDMPMLSHQSRPKLEGVATSSRHDAHSPMQNGSELAS